MSLYYEAADLLKAPGSAGGSLKSKIFSNQNLKSQPAQLYALVIETSKWSFVLKEVIERATLLSLERKLTPILSLLLAHDLLLAKRGIALPATHGLRTSVERHKARLHAEFTKARIRRGLGSVEALKEFVDLGEDGHAGMELPYPRWIRINTLRTQLEDQLETTFADYERVGTVNSVRQRGSRRLYLDVHVPNLIAVSPSVDLMKTDAYLSGALILQDKASCFPAYLLDPLPEDGDIMDTCAAPGNKTTHLAAIILGRATDPEDFNQTIHAFEKNKVRAETLKKMIGLADSQKITKVHAGQDFLKVDPNDPAYREVGALLLDPSCSGSGIVGRDDMPELHVPSQKPDTFTSTPKGKSKSPKKGKEKEKEKEKEKDTLKRKRDIESVEEPLDMIDDDGILEPMTSESQLQARLSALSSFQLSLLLHAMAFPAARKITYSTCSIHAAENEDVVLRAAASDVARERGWRILRRDEQVRGMREWPVRGDEEACRDDASGDVREGCVRANKGDEFATMGFFLAGFVRDGGSRTVNAAPAGILRDEKGFIVRDLLGFPVIDAPRGDSDDGDAPEDGDSDGEEWNGFDDDDNEMEDVRVPVENSLSPLLEGVDTAMTADVTDVVQGIGYGVPEMKRKKKTKKSK